MFAAATMKKAAVGLLLCCIVLGAYMGFHGERREAVTSVNNLRGLMERNVAESHSGTEHQLNQVSSATHTQRDVHVDFPAIRWPADLHGAPSFWGPDDAERAQLANEIFAEYPEDVDEDFSMSFSYYFY